VKSALHTRSMPAKCAD